MNRLAKPGNGSLESREQIRVWLVVVVPPLQGGFGRLKEEVATDAFDVAITEDDVVTAAMPPEGGLNDSDARSEVRAFLEVARIDVEQ